jgi:predicted nucleotide-binding protein
VSKLASSRNGHPDSAPSKRKPSLLQTDVPSFPLAEALRVARTIADEYAKRPSTPLQVARAMGMTPNSGNFRMLVGASAAYGLTDGGAWAERISLTDLGRRIVAPTTEGEDHLAREHAIMNPRVIREFLQKYNGSRWPRDDIGRNVLEDMGVPTEQSGRALGLIRSNAEAVGLVTECKGFQYVELRKAMTDTASAVAATVLQADDHGAVVYPLHKASESATPPALMPPTPLIDNRRVYVTHGSNQPIVEQIKSILTFGNFQPVVSVESCTGAKPVPDKVLDDMRSCGAGIVHVGAEVRLAAEDGTEHVFPNSNVLIEIGAAMALYGRRFILLVERGVHLPSNLQGLFEVRYEGESLDHEATMKLLEAFNGFRD